MEILDYTNNLHQNQNLKYSFNFDQRFKKKLCSRLLQTLWFSRPLHISLLQLFSQDTNPLWQNTVLLYNPTQFCQAIM